MSAANMKKHLNAVLHLFFVTQRKQAAIMHNMSNIIK